MEQVCFCGINISGPHIAACTLATCRCWMCCLESPVSSDTLHRPVLPKNNAQRPAHERVFRWFGIVVGIGREGDWCARHMACTAGPADDAFAGLAQAQRLKIRRPSPCPPLSFTPPCVGRQRTEFGASITQEYVIRRDARCVGTCLCGFSVGMFDVKSCSVVI